MILSLKKSASNFNVFHNFKYPVLLLFLRKNILCYLDEIKKKKKYTHKPVVGVSKLVLF